MSGIYEQLKSQLGDGFDPKAGFSTLDMIHFPAPVRRIIRIVMRRMEVSLEDLNKAIQELPEEKRPSQEEVDESLAAMIKVGWLEQTEREGVSYYRIDMGKKAGSEVTRASPSQKTQSTMSKLWDTVDEAAQEGEKPALDLRRDKRKSPTADLQAGLEKKETPSQEEAAPAPTAGQSRYKESAQPSGSPKEKPPAPVEKTESKEPVKEAATSSLASQKEAGSTPAKSDGPPKSSKRHKKAASRLLDGLLKNRKSGKPDA
jgi:hypothetical protein